MTALVLADADPTARIHLAQPANTEIHLVNLWLHGRSAHTQRAYRADIGRFLAFVATPLPTVTLSDLQAFADALAQQALAPSSRVRTLAAVKSLLAFGQRTGYLPLNVGAALKLPPKKDRLAERILSETQVHRILALEPSKRNQALLRLLYAGGLRVSELAALRWRDLQPRDDASQVTILGKGGNTRVVPLPASVWQELEGLRREPQHRRSAAVRGSAVPQSPASANRIWRMARQQCPPGSLPVPDVSCLRPVAPVQPGASSQLPSSEYQSFGAAK